MRWVAGFALAALALLSAPAAAPAADAWVVTGRSTLPPQYWQGVAFDPSGTSWFAGPVVGLYRDDPGLRETARVDSALVAGEPFNHIGDLEFDPRENGRLLLPLECYDPAHTPSNTCGIGAVGVADPATFARRYTVALNGVPKAMWLALGPDGRLWTQAGPDLLSFSADAVAAGVAAIDPSGSLPGVFDGEADGAAVLGGRLYFTRQEAGGVQQLWSLDLGSGAKRLEATVGVIGESEGLAAYPGLGGALHWVIAPGLYPDATYGHQSVLVHLNPRGAALPGKAQRLSPVKLRATPSRPLRAGRTVTLTLRAWARIVGTTVAADGAVVRVAGKAVTLDASGLGKLRMRVPHARTWRITASRRGLRPTVVRLRVSLR
jgi:hypothetical protein